MNLNLNFEDLVQSLGNEFFEERPALLQKLFEIDNWADKVLNMLSDKSYVNRINAIDLFFECGLYPPNADRIRPLLLDESRVVRTVVCRNLSMYGDSNAVLPLIDCLASETDADIRAMAICALGNISDQRALSCLVEIRDTDTGQNYEGESISEIASRAISSINENL